jgi:6-phosphofructokinase 1
MVALQNEKIVDIKLEEALAVPKRVDVEGDTVLTARGLGISFGDQSTY